MTTSINLIPDTKPAKPPRSAPADSGTKGTGFTTQLDIEQADVLMRQTDQYANWQNLCQIHDSKCAKTAQIILERHKLLQNNYDDKTFSQQQFDFLTTQLEASGIYLPTFSAIKVAQEDISQTIPKTSIALPQPLTTAAIAPTVLTNKITDNSTLSEDDLLILDLISPDIGLNQIIVGYGDRDKAFLPLREFVQALDFPIKTNAESGTATGWFISEDRSFELDIAKKSIRINNENLPWDSGAILIRDENIFVDQRTLSKWFPVDFELSFSNLSVSMTPRERLPVQDQLDREKKRIGLLDKRDMSLRYPVEETQYKLFSFPVMDVSFTEGISAYNSEPFSRYYVLADGDLAAMGAEVFFSGDEDNWTKEARITLNRTDPDSKLLGPLNASEVFLGDVSPTSIPIIGSPDNERGVAIANGDINRSADFDSTRFEGNIQPGWDVELYRNGNLVKSLRAGNDGRYIFDNVDMFYGANSFQIVAFGPQGQQRVVEEKNINVGGDMLTPGKTYYSLSASQRNKTVLGLKERDDSAEESLRLNGKMEVGITEYLTATAGLSSVAFNDARHNYLQTGLNGGFSSFYGQADYIIDTEGGSALSVQGQVPLGPVNLKVKQESFFDFIAVDSTNEKIESRNSLGFSGRLPESSFSSPIVYSLTNYYTFYENSESGRLNSYLATNIGPLRLSNKLGWNYSDTGKKDIPFVGNFYASANIDDFRVTGGIRYAIGDESEINEYSLSSTWRILDDLSASGNLVQHTGATDRLNSNVGLDWDTGKVILSPSVSYDSEGGFGGFLRLSFSLGTDNINNDILLTSERRASKGAASALVYYDENNNKIFDQTDTPLPDVEIVARQSRKKATTNEQGVAYIANLKTFNPVDIEIDTETLEDPFWHPTTSGTAVVPRPGFTHTMEFPVVTTGEIDGTVFALNSNGEKQILSSIQLQIYNEENELVQTTNSDYDGFYLFEKVEPGTYNLRIRKSDLFRMNLTSADNIEIVINGDGTISNGNDIILHSLEKEAIPKTSTSDGEVDRVHPTELISSVTKPVPSNTKINIQSISVLDGSQGRNLTVSAIQNQIKPNVQRPLTGANSPNIPAAVEEKTNTKNSVTANSISIGDLSIVKETQKENVSKPSQPMILGDITGIEKQGKPFNSSLEFNRETTPREIQSVDQIFHQFSPILSIGNPIKPFTPIEQLDSRRRPSTVRTRSIQSNDKYISEAPSSSNPVLNKKNEDQIYGVHLASYRSAEDAHTGIAVLSKRLDGMIDKKQLKVIQVDLGPEKGIWYRVVYGSFDSAETAEMKTLELKPATDYSKTIAQARIQALPNNPSKLDRPRPLYAASHRTVANTYATMQNVK